MRRLDRVTELFGQCVEPLLCDIDEHQSGTGISGGG